MAALLYCTGMRIEEVLGLRWEDIDTERGCIHIRRAVVHSGRNMPEIKSTKSKAERTIPLPRHLLDELSPKEETGFLSPNPYLAGGPCQRTKTKAPAHRDPLLLCRK